METKEYRCLKCKLKMPGPSHDHLCNDCRENAPKRDGITDLTSLHRRVVKPRPFVGDDGEILTGELPMRPLWETPKPNELWAVAGMDEASKRRNHIHE